MQLSFNKYKTVNSLHSSYKITDTHIYIYNKRIPSRVEADTHQKGIYIYSSWQGDHICVYIYIYIVMICFCFTVTLPELQHCSCIKLEFKKNVHELFVRER